MSTILDINATKSVKMDKAENGPIAVVGMIDTPSRAHILDMMESKSLKFADRVRLVRHSLKEWSSVVDVKGAPILFETEEIYIPGVGKRKLVSDACLNHLSEGAIIKISSAAVELNFETEEKEKNSVTPSTQ